MQGQGLGEDKAWLALGPRNIRTNRHSWHVAGGAGGREEVGVPYALPSLAEYLGAKARPTLICSKGRGQGNE